MISFQLLLGCWLGILQLPDAGLPFQFELASHDGHPVMIIKNAGERIECDEVQMRGDSLIISLPLYDSEFRLKAEPGSLHGLWINRGRKIPAEIPFSAVQNCSDRFPMRYPVGENTRLNGLWETWFDTNTPDSSIGIGLFEENRGNVSGTFLTESGDHRFLEGVLDGDSLKLSVFDGTHVWLYLARLKDQKMEGMFYSGNHYKAPFHAFRNDQVRLRDPESISSGSGKIEFTLPDPDSNMVSSSDPVFKNKPLILQIMGTWCPNCKDESAFLDSIYQARSGEGLEIIGLSFERSPDFSIAANQVRRFKNRLRLHYPILIAGVVRKGEVEKVIPALRNFFSYPTTVFIDRKGQIVKVSSGFSGPATGKYWDEYQKDMKRTIDRLVR